jgi:hypothetical protein
MQAMSRQQEVEIPSTVYTDSTQGIYAFIASHVAKFCQENGLIAGKPKKGAFPLGAGDKDAAEGQTEPDVEANSTRDVSSGATASKRADTAATALNDSCSDSTLSPDPVAEASGGEGAGVPSCRLEDQGFFRVFLGPTLGEQLGTPRMILPKCRHLRVNLSF